MRPATVDHLLGCAREVAKKHNSPDLTYVAFGLAQEYLRFAIGNEWTNQIVFGLHPTVDRANRAGRGFVRAEATMTTDQYRNQERTLRLAEILFNLQAVEGVDGRVAKLLAGQVEPTYAELECGGMLLDHAIPFRFVEERGVRGADFDAEMLLSSGGVAPCEMKCKLS
jgi:hypothetical protein